MAKMLGTRQSSVIKVVFFVPSWTWTKGVPLPVPYPVFKKSLKAGTEVSDDVRYNKSWAYIKDSNTQRVYADEVGKMGVLSGVVSKKSVPLDYSESVFVDGKNAVRCGDMAWMNNKNTIGFHIGEPPVPKPAITDTGKAAEAMAAPEIPSIGDLF